MKIKNKKKIVLITNIPNPYRIPLFNLLALKLKEENIILLVVFGASGYKRRQWKIDLSQVKFQYKILNSSKISFFNVEKVLFSYRGLIPLLNKELPDLIITNGFTFSTFKIFVNSFFKDKKYLIWTGSIRKKFYKSYFSFLKEYYIQSLLKKSKGAIVYGKLAEKYLISLGMDKNKIDIAINTVDTDYFYSKRKIKKKSIYKLLYIGELSIRKNVMMLLEAFKILVANRSDIMLDIVGSGSEKYNLMNFVRRNKLEDHVSFHGFKQKSEIKLFLNKADCFLFQTEYDIWGLVLVEAMASGLPCIASINAGSTDDLIKEGHNGFKLNFSNYDEFVKKINLIINDHNNTQIISNNASKYIRNNVTLNNCIDGFIKSIKKNI